jgi:hypothetical protein
VPGSVGDEVELVEALAGWEAGGADAGLTAVGLAGRHFPLPAGGEELLVAPGLPASSRHDHRPSALPRGRARTMDTTIGVIDCHVTDPRIWRRVNPIALSVA